MVISLITGGFDPVHSGHVELIKSAGRIGSVVVGLNSDRWLQSKKGMPFMPFEERRAVLETMQHVVKVIAFDDSDGTAIDAIRSTQQLFPHQQIVFCNGGDRTGDNIPEHSYCLEHNVEMRFDVGGGKANSSSWLLANWNTRQPSKQLRQTVFTNGCFDILHVGHIQYLEQSRALGDKLIVGLNSDDSVRRLKGLSRPVNSQADRKRMLQALRCVDEVVIFDEDTPYDLIASLQPDIVTKGGDYRPEEVVGYDLSKVVVLPYVEGKSTTRILNHADRGKGLGPRRNLG
jgi:D-glycero-beta-D-manno-heptose 1-phosphate adenylyltransferase